MLDPKSWLHLAQALRLDEQRRVRHDCGEGTPMVVYHKDEGWSAYCHRCGDPGFVPRPAESLAERVARVAARQLVEAQASSSIVPPMPAVADVTQWPALARVWLYKAGLSNDDIHTLGIYYHEQTDRVVVPIIADGVLIYWQARDYAWTPKSSRPKYLNPTAAGTQGGVRFGGGTDRIVLTEDYLSGYRVHMAGYTTHCLLGTKLSTAALSRLCRDGVSRVSVWLDNDLGRLVNPGQVAARKIGQQLRAMGFAVDNIVSTKDPKAHSRKEIIWLLK